MKEKNANGLQALEREWIRMVHGEPEMSPHEIDSFVSSAWTRLEFEETPVYVRDCPPAWFVPNRAGDDLLRNMADGAPPSDDWVTARFLHRLPSGGRSVHPGRAALLSEPHLRELWLHLTDRCNMACRHCLFAASPHAGEEMPSDEVLRLAAEARAMGTRVFALTGGEPFIHPEFREIVETLLADRDTHVVVLTNGLLLRKFGPDILRWGPERFHLQVSVDGLPARHDAVRGTGAFDRLMNQLAFLQDAGFPFTVSMCVDAENVEDMPRLVEKAAALGATNIHFMWLFVKGRAHEERFADPERILAFLREADACAQRLGLALDNLEAFKTQVFAPQGTIHDGTTAGWESAALGPDGQLYPSAAMIGVRELATPIPGSLADAWTGSPVLQEMREASANGMDHPLRYLLGGGDSDHSYTHGGCFIGADPYQPLYEQIALWLMTRAAGKGEVAAPRLRLKMGDILESCGAHGRVALVHSNCLLSTAQEDGRTAVKSYYSEAAVSTKEDILNPACYPAEMLDHIPPELRFRGYGCGSPVVDAAPQPGETVVDLGCGRGVECFLAARAVGAKGHVIGVDMLDPMLKIACSGAARVADNLGYENMEFRKGYLESLPLETDSVDLVISNCVLNLTADKRRTFAEICRVLRPGGRLVVSDVVTEHVPDAAILNDEVLRGECIAGAMTHRDLVGILDESGFGSFRLIKRVPYRDVQGHRFFSMTYEALHPAISPMVRAIYRGPMAALQSPSGRILFAGIPAELPREEARQMGESVAILDDQGVAVNLKWESTCSCATPIDLSPAVPETQKGASDTDRHMSDCMVCGAPLVYRPEGSMQTCAYCGREENANAVCEAGHFVCDTCHAAGAVAVIEHLCRSTTETDMLALMQTIRKHPSVPMHGPEYHGLVPGIILATYRNLGGRLPPGYLETGIRRGAKVMGGSCAFTGTCGAAAGVGIALSLLMDANPLAPAERQRVMQAVNQVSHAIAKYPAARCCQRDVWTALRQAAQLSKSLLPISLRAKKDFPCEQFSQNPHCLGKACPLLPVNCTTLNRRKK